jgi:hypothetical protein
MTSPLTPRSPDSAFYDDLGRLVAVLRSQPDDTAARTSAVQAAARAVAHSPARIEAGVENELGADELNLKSRLLARRVDAIEVLAGATPDEILALAEGLASDLAPIPCSARIRVESLPMIELPPETPVTHSGPRRSLASPAFAIPGWMAAPRREGTVATLADSIAELSARLASSLHEKAWRQALHAMQSLIRLIPAVPENQRRGISIAIRRHLTKVELHQFIEYALRTPEEQVRAVEVAQWAGLDGAEVMLDAICESETTGAREFLFQGLAGIPEAGPMVLSLLSRPRWYEIRHGAELAGRMRLIEAIPLLREQMNHPEERVRQAVIMALGRFDERAAVEPLRQALSHSSAQTRATAGRALGGRHLAPLAMPLLAALEAEKDPGARRELLAALAGIEAPEAMTALIRMSTERKSLFGRKGYAAAQRLEVVEALAAAGTPFARQALQRIVVEGDHAVREAAKRALTVS